MALDQWEDKELITKDKMNAMVDAINENTTGIAQVPDATINVVTQAQYDALADKSGVYFIEGGLNVNNQW